MSQIDFLKKIEREKQPIIQKLYTKFGLNYFKDQENKFPRNSFYNALQKPGLNLIAELKKASPSKGLINANFEPEKLAITYQKQGASALSVLTEETYFLGSITYLSLAKKTTQCPLLRKDFITDPIELYEARAFGADAALLIKAMLDQDKCQMLINTAKDIGLDILLEVHDENELIEALNLKNVTIIGINNRNLHSLKVDVETAHLLRKKYDKYFQNHTILTVAESGYSNIQQLQKLQNEGFNAVLIGEGLVTHPEILNFWHKKS